MTIVLARALLMLAFTLAFLMPLATLYWPFITQPLWQWLGIADLNRHLLFWGPPLLLALVGTGAWWVLEVAIAPRLTR
jgi:hypothetical protein